jgi:uncharacterized integral membrane protein
MTEPTFETVRMTPEERAVFERRRKQRNWAILGVLVVLVVLFFLISNARVLRG